MISDQELARWREETRQQALNQSISPEEVDWLLQAVTGLTPLQLRLNQYPPQVLISVEQLTELWQKRVQKRVPVQYLVGETPWRDFNLTVSPGVLIPRPETEQIIEIALDAAGEAFQNRHWVDLGTGTGAIAIALAQALPEATIHAVDNSATALSIAQQNAQQLGLETKIQFYQGSWFSPLKYLQGNLSVMVANPPYIPTAMLKQLQPEVAQHEPQSALDGGEDGLAVIRHLIATAPEFLHDSGVWLTEMMKGQGEIIYQLLVDNGNYTDINLIPDFAGIERFALAYVSKSTSGFKMDDG